MQASFIKLSLLSKIIMHTRVTQSKYNPAYDEYSYTYCTDEFKNSIEKSGLTSDWSFCKQLRDLSL